MAKTLKDVYQEKSSKLLDGVAYWGAFYRANPQRFVLEYLNIHLKCFQKILIYMMMASTNFMYIASRGSGKTWLTSLYCVVRCILYPGTKICIASSVKEQAIECIQKIQEDFMKLHDWGSANLRNEIEEISDSVNGAHCDFKNGSWIKVVVSKDSARHNRANIIIVDEFRMVPLDIINTVLRKFLTAERMPGYLKDPKYAHLKERNCEIYMSSAWYKSHWSYKKLQAYFINLLNPEKRYFMCGLPYQLAIKEGLLSREQVEDEMSEEDFDEISWSMEMDALFYGESNSSFFKYDDINARRKIKKAFYPLEVYKNHNLKPPELMLNERRILSVDVALMSSKRNKNDNTAIFINSAVASEHGNYISNFVYGETHEGKTTNELGLIIMRTYYQYNCTDLVLDTNGVGMGIYDFLIMPQYDPDYGVTYEPLNCCNNDVMADRCKHKNADRAIWSIKANADFNSKCATAFRLGFQNGTINLLINEFEGEEYIHSIRGFGKMSAKEKAMLKMPYAQTTMLVNETINLNVSIQGSNIKIEEKYGNLKDRYSSCSYSHYIAQEIGRMSIPKVENTESIITKLIIKRGTNLGKTI